MVSNDYRELILFMMIYQTPKQFSALSTFDPTFLINPRHRLIWFPGWLEIDLFVRRNEERLEWRGAPPPGLLMFHDSLCSYPGHSACGAWPERAGCDRGQQWAVAVASSHYRVWPGTDIQLRPDMELSATERVGTAAARSHSATGTEDRTLQHIVCHLQCFELKWDKTHSYWYISFVSFYPHNSSSRASASPWPRYCPVWRQLSGQWPPPAWLSPLLLSPTQTYNWNKSRTPPQNNQFRSILSYIFIQFYDHENRNICISANFDTSTHITSF